MFGTVVVVVVVDFGGEGGGVRRERGREGRGAKGGFLLPHNRMELCQNQNHNASQDIANCYSTYRNQTGRSIIMVHPTEKFQFNTLVERISERLLS